jgi:hypothetical protein
MSSENILNSENGQEDSFDNEILIAVASMFAVFSARFIVKVLLIYRIFV